MKTRKATAALMVLWHVALYMCVSGTGASPQLEVNRAFYEARTIHRDGGDHHLRIVLFRACLSSPEASSVLLSCPGSASPLPDDGSFAVNSSHCPEEGFVEYTSSSISTEQRPESWRSCRLVVDGTRSALLKRGRPSSRVASSSHIHHRLVDFPESRSTDAVPSPSEKKELHDLLLRTMEEHSSDIDSDLESLSSLQYKKGDWDLLPHGPDFERHQPTDGGLPGRNQDNVNIGEDKEGPAGNDSDSTSFVEIDSHVLLERGTKLSPFESDLLQDTISLIQIGHRLRTTDLSHTSTKMVYELVVRPLITIATKLLIMGLDKLMAMMFNSPIALLLGKLISMFIYKPMKVPDYDFPVPAMPDPFEAAGGSGVKGIGKRDINNEMFGEEEESSEESDESSGGGGGGGMPKIPPIPITGIPWPAGKFDANLEMVKKGGKPGSPLDLSKKAWDPMMAMPGLAEAKERGSKIAAGKDKPDWIKKIGGEELENGEGEDENSENENEKNGKGGKNGVNGGSGADGANGEGGNGGGGGGNGQGTNGQGEGGEGGEGAGRTGKDNGWARDNPECKDDTTGLKCRTLGKQAVDVHGDDEAEQLAKQGRTKTKCVDKLTGIECETLGHHTDTDKDGNTQKVAAANRHREEELHKKEEEEKKKKENEKDTKETTLLSLFEHKYLHSPEVFLEVRSRILSSSHAEAHAKFITGPLVESLVPKLLDEVGSSIMDQTEMQVDKMLSGLLPTQLENLVPWSVGRSVTRACVESQTVGLTTGILHAIATLMTKELSEDITKYVAESMIPELTYSLSMTISHAFLRAPMEDYFCWYMETSELYVSDCKASMIREYYQGFYTTYYARYFEKYYTSSYSGYYAKNFANPGKRDNFDPGTDETPNPVNHCLDPSSAECTPATTTPSQDVIAEVADV